MSAYPRALSFCILCLVFCASVSMCLLVPRIMHSVPAVMFCCVRGGTSCVPAVCRRSCVRECFMCVPRVSHVTLLFGDPPSHIGVFGCVHVHGVLNHKSFDLCFADRAVRNRPSTNNLLPFWLKIVVCEFQNPSRPRSCFEHSLHGVWDLIDSSLSFHRKLRLNQLEVVITRCTHIY